MLLFPPDTISRLQKYRLTAKGLAWLVQRGR